MSLFKKKYPIDIGIASTFEQLRQFIPLYKNNKEVNLIYLVDGRIEAVIAVKILDIRHRIDSDLLNPK